MNSHDIIENITLTIDKANVGARLDVFVSDHIGVTRSKAQKMIDDGDVNVNGLPLPKRYRVAENDTVTVSVREPESYDAEPEDIPLDVVYEDSDIIIVNKPKGMVVHPAPGNETGTLVNALLFHCGASLSGIGGVLRPGIVHRIDKDTTGLLAVAKNDAAHESLSKQLENHNMHREYRALVLGRAGDGVVDAAIDRHPVDRKRMAVVNDKDRGREARTEYRTLSTYTSQFRDTYSLVDCRLYTGRTHQIRVHMAHIGHPVAGDITYGGGRTKFERMHEELFRGQCLHAYRLTLTHPKTGEVCTFEAPLTEDFVKILSLLTAE